VTAVLEPSGLESSTLEPIVPRPRRRRRNLVPNLLGILVFVVATFPVY